MSERGGTPLRIPMERHSSVHITRRLDSLVASALSVVILGLIWTQLDVRAPPLRNPSPAFVRLEVEFIDAKKIRSVDGNPQAPKAKLPIQPPSPADPTPSHAVQRKSQRNRIPTPSTRPDIDNMADVSPPTDHVTRDDWQLLAGDKTFEPSIMRRRDDISLASDRVLPNVKVRDNSIAARWQRLARRQDCQELRARLQSDPGSAESILLTMQRRGCVTE
ncbi:hypothetical protein P6166_12135 [Stenotrophomonas sp. HITSZ_GD]|uniref:hypothetical protein n=1 Tax=Stenotrophomonas sp. HITSZ_GD TaxID=3037248 RepID=UPI00240E55DC|nr:hypothetical protein [Stenotrophomonas sp. HITSZ_GD]MDG2526105.1 hypothetical protein [Stenotrophomonas sp. HITSZ_GD]